MLSLLLSSLVTFQRFEVQELPIRGHLRGPYASGAMLVHGEGEVLVLDRDLTVKERIKVASGALPVLDDGKVRFVNFELSDYIFNPQLRVLFLDDHGLPWYGWTREMKLVFADTEKAEIYDGPPLDILPLGRREPGYFFYYSGDGVMKRSSKTAPLEESLELKDAEGNKISVVWYDGLAVIDSRRAAFVGVFPQVVAKPSLVPRIVLPDLLTPGAPEKDYLDAKKTIYVADFDTRQVVPLLTVEHRAVWDKSSHPRGLVTRLRYRPAERDLVFVVDKYIFRVPVR